jgi:hypothetical protein
VVLGKLGNNCSIGEQDKLGITCDVHAMPLAIHIAPSRCYVKPAIVKTESPPMAFEEPFHAPDLRIVRSPACLLSIPLALAGQSC